MSNVDQHFEFKDIPYITCAGELWYVFEKLWSKWSCYKATQLYYTMLENKTSMCDQYTKHATQVLLKVSIKAHTNCCCRITLQWRHNGHDSVSNHQPNHCSFNRLFIRRSKKTSKLCVTGLCAGNSPGTGEFTAQMSSNAENVSIWWRHHEKIAVWQAATFMLFHVTNKH